MATRCGIIHLFIFSIALLSLGSSSFAVNAPSNKPRSFILPIEKDQKTLQYSTSVEMGTPAVTLDLVIDIRERFLWFECGSDYNSSTYRPVRCGTKNCIQAKGTDCISCLNHPLKTGCTNNTCGVQPFNPFGAFYVSGDVGQDTLSSAHSTTRARTPSNLHVPAFISSCVYPDKFGVEGFLLGLARGKKGLLGLANTAVSLPAQLATKYHLQRKFALCLPSSSKFNKLGDLFVGGGPYYLPPHDASKFLTYTPLVTNPHSTGPIFDDDPSSEYFIDVKSIKVDGKTVNVNTSLLSIDELGNGGTKLSTVIPYTTLHSSIYRPLVNAFVKKAAVRKMKRVSSVAPFGACFSSRTVGANVPAIDLVLGGGVEWRIYGSNSMVKVNKKVQCLGFVDGGLDGSPIATSIVIGGYQMEDNLVEFDLASSKLGFSSSLLLHNATCSHFRVV
ncbi:gamma conglutin 1-like [Vigna unguiculata]|uniref:Aspartyl protease family protein n=1 Tax=Vigna unguiculata TaxID=3917 RepID=A0A4D6KP56_VIGUN|nr:gamma conglutin 1-like [Vigna unguiculata]QCD79876.1 aspartyl protease family protein [Vigna unguiculata]